MSISKELVLSVRQRVAENPEILTSQLAVDLNAAEADVVIALPLEMRMHASVEDFAALWRQISTWRHTRVTLSGANGTISLMPGGPLPKGHQKSATFYFEDNGTLPLQELPLWQLGSIWFVSKPVPGGESHAVRFFDRQGGHIFSVYLARNEIGEFEPSSKQAYLELRAQYGVAPKRGHCHGCKNCTCDARRWH